MHDPRRRVTVRIRVSAVVSALLILAACGDPSEPVMETPTLDLERARVVWAEHDGGVPRLLARNLASGDAVEIRVAGEYAVMGGGTDRVSEGRLIFIARPRWSPDGTRVAVVLGDRDEVSWLVVVDVADTTAPRLAIREDPRTVITSFDWSPGSDRLAWITDHVGELGLFVADLTQPAVSQVNTDAFLNESVVRFGTLGELVISSVVQTVDTGSVPMPVTRISRIDPGDGSHQTVYDGVEGRVTALARSGFVFLLLKPAAWDEVSGTLTTRAEYHQPALDEVFNIGGAPGDYRLLRLADRDRRAIVGRHVGGPLSDGLELTRYDITARPIIGDRLFGTDRVEGLGDVWRPGG